MAQLLLLFNINISTIIMNIKLDIKMMPLEL